MCIKLNPSSATNDNAEHKNQHVDKTEDYDIENVEGNTQNEISVLNNVENKLDDILKCKTLAETKMTKMKVIATIKMLKRHKKMIMWIKTLK